MSGLEILLFSAGTLLPLAAAGTVFFSLAVSEFLGMLILVRSGSVVIFDDSLSLSLNLYFIAKIPLELLFEVVVSFVLSLILELLFSFKLISLSFPSVSSLAFGRFYIDFIVAKLYKILLLLFVLLLLLRLPVIVSSEFILIFY